VGSVRPLAQAKPSKTQRSILEEFGSRGSEGVVGGQLLWGILGSYTFSLRNQLRENVRNVVCLVVFYDRQNAPIEFDLVGYRETIPAGLSKRLESEVHESIRTLTGGGLEKPPQTKIEFRVLNFDIAK
jgi:hypothetical protein